ncbi:MAG: ferritin-like domain-containing protein [Candidatus Cryosericum sp.]
MKQTETLVAFGVQSGLLVWRRSADRQHRCAWKASGELPKGVLMASKKLLGMLNDAIAGELQVSLQYMWQHVQWKGVKHFSVKDEFKKTGVEEMKHAEAIAERLFCLGGTPTTKPDPITVGLSLKEMLTTDMKAEEKTVKMYKEIIALATKEEDLTTAHLFTEILGDEEGHLDTFQSLLEEI